MSDQHAFPCTTDVMVGAKGMTKRELFAAMALQGLLSAEGRAAVGIYAGPSRFDDSARGAVAHADALLAALEAKP